MSALSTEEFSTEGQLAFFTINQFATKLGIHPNTVRRSIKSGKIRAFKVGTGKRSRYRIPYSEIDRIALFDLEDIIEKIIAQRESER